MLSNYHISAEAKAVLRDMSMQHSWLNHGTIPMKANSDIEGLVEGRYTG